MQENELVQLAQPMSEPSRKKRKKRGLITVQIGNKKVTIDKDDYKAVSDMMIQCWEKPPNYEDGYDQIRLPTWYNQLWRCVPDESLTCFQIYDILVLIDEDDDERRIQSLVLPKYNFSFEFPKRSLSNLKKLILSSYSGIHDSIELLRNLEHLALINSENLDNLGSESNSELPEVLWSLSILRSLTLLGHLRSIPPTIGKLKNLEHVELSCTGVEELPEEFYSLSTLQSLAFESENMRIPEKIGDLVNLRRLELRYFQVYSLPRSIGKLENLDHVHIEFTSIEELPEEFWGLPALRTLHIERSNLTIPQEIEQLQNLEHLTFTPWKPNEPTRTPPAEIGSLARLRELVLDSLPPSKSVLENLNQLQTLDLTEVDDFELQDLEFLKKLPKLVFLRLPRDIYDHTGSDDFLLDMVQTNSQILEVSHGLIGDCDARRILDHSLACNRYNDRTKKSTAPLYNLWPMVLSNATRAFDSFPSSYKIALRDAIYVFLLDRRESFVKVLMNRRPSNME